MNWSTLLVAFILTNGVVFVTFQMCKRIKEYDRTMKLRRIEALRYAMEVEDMKLRIKTKKLHENAIVPYYAHTTDSGADLFTLEDRILKPFETTVIPTGIAIDIPPGFEAQVRPRSGVTADTPLKVALGTVDQGYKGDVGIIVQNVSTYDYGVPARTKLAQLVFAPVEQGHFVRVKELNNSDRGEAGFGSTGV